MPERMPGQPPEAKMIQQDANHEVEIEIGSEASETTDVSESTFWLEYAESQENQEDFELTPDQTEKKRGHCERFSVLEDDELSVKAEEIRERSNFLAKFLPYKGAVNAFVLSSVLAGSACNMSREDLGESGDTFYTATEQIDTEPDLVDVMPEVAEAIKLPSPEKLAELATQNPRELMSFYYDFKDNPDAEQLITTAAETAPGFMLQYMSNFESEPWFSNVVDAMVEASPGDAYTMLAQKPYGEQEAQDLALFTQELADDPSEKAAAVLEIYESDMKKSQKRAASMVLSYALDHDLDMKTLERITRNENHFADAMIWTSVNGTEAEKVKVDSRLDAHAENIIKQMNRAYENDQENPAYRYIYRASTTELYTLLARGGEYAQLHPAQSIVDEMFREMRKKDMTTNAMLETTDYQNYQDVFLYMIALDRIDKFVDGAGSAESQEELLDRFVQDIAGDHLEKRMGQIAQANFLLEDGPVRDQMIDSLKKSFTLETDKGAKAAYGILLALSAEGKGFLGEQAAEYEVELPDSLDVEKLRNNKGEVVETQYFYSDDDGRDSFQNMVWKHKLQPDKWSVEDMGTFIKISTKGEENKMVIYANKPDASVAGDREFQDRTMESVQRVQSDAGREGNINDIPLQAWANGRPNGFEDMQRYMEEQGQEASVVMHRGHSFYTAYTIRQLNESTRLYYDGSCHGANKAASAYEKSHDIQVVNTVGSGRTRINDMYILNINNQIAEGQTIKWNDIAKETVDGLPEAYDEDDRMFAVQSLSQYILPNDQRAKGALVKKHHREITG